MSPRLRIAIPAVLVVAVVVAGVAMSGGLGPQLPDLPRALNGPGAIGSGDPLLPVPTPTPRPEVGGTELYGYLPYWRMTDSTADYLRSVPLSRIALFSITARRDGALHAGPAGYGRITGEVGRRIIAEAHDRGVRVDLVFTSFGERKNAVFFGRAPGGRPMASPPASGSPSSSAPSATSAPFAPSDPAPAPWERTVGQLVTLADSLDVDGINVDVELLDEADREAYGEFLAALRKALVEARPKARLSVATEAGVRGVANAAEAASAGVDRIFLMGYDYHWSGSQPGASSPVERIDGLYDLRWSIDQYVEAGVPRDRILLGLPLYGMTWRTEGPDRFSRVLGKGQAWILDGHHDVLLDAAFEPQRDAIEVAEFFVEPDGKAWRHTYYDSPDTLRLKLALARDHGLAGGGFWAIGYEQGLPGYIELMNDFRDDKIERSEAPAP